MKTIIAPTDFSPISINAVNYAADMAFGINAKLILLHVIHLPIMAAELPVSKAIYSDLLDEAETEMAALCDKILQATGNNILVETITVFGFFQQQIKSLCRINKPFAVVMATKGAGATSHLLFGSNTIYAAKNLHCPVIVIPENKKFTGIKNIALASDLKDVSETIHFDYIKNLLKLFDARLDIVCIMKNDSGVHKKEMTGAITFQNQLDKFHPQLHFITSPNIEAGVLEFAKDNKADLLIIIPKKHGLLESLFHKSQSKSFIDHPHIPMLFVTEA
ncbi:universal stress protein [Ginsengibacter hankyongi]|uniref:Universal stress protein n=1 Tax=Ginsengibacter hankyongi TaxID=2607284 RepID=A0A5J5IHQ3_9BACT|nr:universal stress protein [Ginsengibacter hankyongi]KAA9040615.1 universal stress protein [Ginsengibacter hankyongi]